MKNLFERLFKKESQFNYVIAEYQPLKTNWLQTDVPFTDYELDLVAEKDDMDIDKIYQST